MGMRDTNSRSTAGSLAMGRKLYLWPPCAFKVRQALISAHGRRRGARTGSNPRAPGTEDPGVRGAVGAVLAGSLRALLGEGSEAVRSDRQAAGGREAGAIPRSVPANHRTGVRRVALREVHSQLCAGGPRGA